MALSHPYSVSDVKLRVNMNSSNNDFYYEYFSCKTTLKLMFQFVAQRTETPIPVHSREQRYEEYSKLQLTYIATGTGK